MTSRIFSIDMTPAEALLIAESGITEAKSEYCKKDLKKLIYVYISRILKGLKNI